MLYVKIIGDSHLRRIFMKKIICIAIIICIAFSNLNVAYAAEVPLKDISKHWAKDNIASLYNQRVVAGYPDGTYKPDSPITLIEFLKLATLGIGYKLESGHMIWYEHYLSKALEIGLIDSKAYPDIMAQVTREQIAEIAVKAVLNVEEKPSQELDEMISMNIRDFVKITDNKKQYVIDAYRIGLFAGTPDRYFNPHDTMTRAEMCTVILRLMDKTKRVPFDPRSNAAIKLYNIYNGLPYTVVRPEKKEEIELAYLMIEAQTKSKGWYFVSYYPDNIASMYYRDEQEYNDGLSSHMTLFIHMDRYENNNQTYDIVVYNPHKTNELHKGSVEVAFKHLFGQDSQKAMTIFDKLLDEGIHGTAKKSDDLYTVGKRKVHVYRENSSGIFAFNIYKKTQ
jgi:hypothetical protein